MCDIHSVSGNKSWSSNAKLCKCLFQSVYVVSWSREGARLPGTAVEANGQLYIAQSAVADSGIYVCTGSNQFGRQTAQVSVRVDPILPPTSEFSARL